MADVLRVCPLCGHHHCSQTHILCNCPGLSMERAGLDHDLALIVNRLHPGPGRSLGRAIQHLLFHHRDIANRGQLWTGLWAPRHRAFYTLDTLPRARRGVGTPALAAHSATERTRGAGAPRTGHGPHFSRPSGKARSRVPLPPTQAAPHRSTTPGSTSPDSTDSHTRLWPRTTHAPSSGTDCLPET